jgi:hypothetical protein
MNGRSLVAGVLLALLALEILPCACFQEPVAGLGPGGFSCRFEPLQVCDSGDQVLGGYRDLPLLLPGPPVLLPALGTRRLEPETAPFAPDGFDPPIDHPPESLG